MGTPALLLVNRKARRGGDDLAAARDCLRLGGYDLIEQYTHGRQSYAKTIAAHRNQVQAIILGGGDGTLNAAAEALVEAQLPVGILPLGTANDLCRTLNIPLDLSGACDVICARHQRRIDLGWVNGKHFFNVASVGLGVKVTRRINRQFKGRWGVLAYLLAAAQVVLRARPVAADIISDGRTVRVKTVQVAVGNGRYYGGGMSMNQEVQIDDGLLNLYSLELERWWHIIPLLPAMWRGTLGDSRRVRLMCAPEFEVRMLKRHRPVNTDGEITTRTPAVFRVVPKALSVFAPPADALSGEW